jgi:tellurite resistance protein TehA-like permease
MNDLRGARMKGMPGVVIAIVAVGIAALTASRVVPPTRLVDVLTFFGAGFAAGAGVIGAVIRRRYDRNG